jgi:hypothetical protein
MESNIEYAKEYMFHKNHEYQKQGFSLNDALLEAGCDVEEKFKDELSDDEIVDVIRYVKSECGVHDDFV